MQIIKTILIKSQRSHDASVVLNIKILQFVTEKISVYVCEYLITQLACMALKGLKAFQFFIVHL